MTTAPTVGRRSPLRVAWKTIKVVVTIVVLLVVAGLIIAVVGIVKAVNDAEKPVGFTAAEFAQVTTGMSSAQVRTVLGKPTDAYFDPTPRTVLGLRGRYHSRQRDIRGLLPTRHRR